MGIVIIAIIVLIILGLFFTFVPVGLWVTAFFSGVRVSLSTLIGMRLRRVNPRQIISPMIKATKAGLDLAIDELENFDSQKAVKLLQDLNLDINKKISKMSKGMQEKLQLILVMSRNAELYILDEPLGGVDPATRDYILDTILSNFCEGATVIISTHLISDIERILDEVIFLDNGEIILTASADEIRNKEKASIDEIFRRYFKC